MMNTNQRLLALTANMPMKQINLPNFATNYVEVPENAINISCCGIGLQYEDPYLQRYHAGTTRDNKDIWLHRFLSNDSERHLHSHPFNFSTIMLNGGYTEQRMDRVTKQIESLQHRVSGTDIDALESLIKRLNHGIEQARPWSEELVGRVGLERNIDVFDWHRIEAVEDETWTLMIVHADRLPFWFFMNDAGDFEAKESSPRDWWKSFGKRGDNLGDVV